MSTCYNCGGEIIFRYVDGQVTPIHLSGSCSSDFSYGGETIREGWSPPTAPVERASQAWQRGHARSDSGVRFTHPTTCPICGAFIFFHTNGNGDVVFFDELGPPWPKHPCLSSDVGRRTASKSPSLMRLVGLYAPPKIIPRPKLSPLSPDEPYGWPNKGDGPSPSVLGVVTRVSERTGWRGRPDTVTRSRISLKLVDICLNGNRWVAVNVPDVLHVSVGQVVHCRPVEDELDGSRALYAHAVEPVSFTGTFTDADARTLGPRTTALSGKPRPDVSRTGPPSTSPTGQRAIEAHPLIRDLAALATGCPLGKVAAVVNTHVLQVAVAPVDKELFRPLQDAFRHGIESGNRDLAAGWLFALELVPLTRRNAIDWRASARRLLSGKISPRP